MPKLRINKYVIIQLAIDLSQALGYSVELQKAVEIGYTLLKMYEVWQYDTVTKYDPITGNGGLFAKCMNTFMKMKASGYPHCDTDQEKTSTLNVYESTKGLLCVQMTFHSMQNVVQSLNVASIICWEILPNPQIEL